MKLRLGGRKKKVCDTGTHTYFHVWSIKAQKRCLAVLANVSTILIPRSGPIHHTMIQSEADHFTANSVESLLQLSILQLDISTAIIMILNMSNQNTTSQSQNNTTSTSTSTNNNTADNSSANFMKIYWNRLDAIKDEGEREKARVLYSSFMLNHPTDFRDLWSDIPEVQRKAQSKLENYIPIYLAQKKQKQQQLHDPPKFLSFYHSQLEIFTHMTKI